MRMSDDTTHALRLALEVMRADLRSCIEVSCRAADGFNNVNAKTPPASGTICDSMVGHVVNQLIAIRQVNVILRFPRLNDNQPEWLDRVIDGEIEI